MGPWEIFGWIAMVCCSFMLIAVTIAVVGALAKPTPTPKKPEGREVMRGGR